MRTLNVILAFLVSFAIAGLVIEGGLRLMGKGPQPTLLQFDPQLGWAKKPEFEHVHKGRGFHVTVRTNEHGLHDDPMPDVAKPADTFRVLMLGDSFAQGFSVGREHLFVDHLERWWQTEGRRIEVINAGTEGYDTAQSVAWLQHNGAAYKPDLVLLFPYENDLYWNSQPHYFARLTGERDKPRYLPDGTLEPRELRRPKEPSVLGRSAIGRLFAGGPVGDDGQHIFRPSGSTRDVHKEFAPLLNDEPAFLNEVRAHTLGALRALRQQTTQLGARGLVVPIPGQTLYDSDAHGRMSGMLGVGRDAWSPNKPVDLFLALAQEAGLETLDPRAFLTERKAAGTELYHEKDWHLNPAGNAAFATFLHSQLDATGVFPAAHIAQQPGTLPAVEPEPRGIPFWLKLYGVLWLVLTGLYLGTYRDEARWLPPLKIAGFLALIFAIFMGIRALAGTLPPQYGQMLVMTGVVVVVGFIAYKLGRRLGTIAELLRSFVMRGHWYLMPLVVVLLTVGSLLVVAASSPLVAPFIYTLF